MSATAMISVVLYPLALMPAPTAAASSLPEGMTEEHAVAQEDTQSIYVSSQVVQPVVVRDTFGVTDPPPPVVEVSSASNRYVTVSPPGQGYSGQAVLDYARQFIGVVPYGNGNSPTDSFDCSGYVQYVFSQFGINFPHSADGIASSGYAISQADAVAGDLVWWPGQHIAFYNGAGGMIDSADWGSYVNERGNIWGDPVFIRLSL